jgi:hypothetical protein
MDTAPMQSYGGKKMAAKPMGFASMLKSMVKAHAAKKKAIKFKKSYQAPAVGGSSFTGPGSAGGGIGG